MQTQVPPAPMAAYVSFPTALLRQQQQQQQQDQTEDELGADLVAQAAFVPYPPLAQSPAPGPGPHYNLSHQYPNVDLDGALGYLANPSPGPPPSVPQEQVLRPLTTPGPSVCLLSVLSAAIRPTSPICTAPPHPACSLDCPHILFFLSHTPSSLLSCSLARSLTLALLLCAHLATSDNRVRTLG